MTSGGLRRDTVAMLAAQSFYRVTGFVLIMVLSRRLGASDIGAFFFATAFAESFVILANAGANPVMARRVAAAPERAAALFSPVLGLRLVSIPLYVLVVVTVAAVVRKAPVWLVATTALIAALEDLYFSFGSLFLALRKAMYNITVGMVVQSAYMAAFLAGMWLRPSLSVLLGVTLFRTAGLATAATWFTSSKVFPLRVRWDTAVVKAGLPFVMIAGLQVLRDQIGTLILGGRAGYEAVAHFALAWRLVATSYFVPTAICSVFVPLLSAHGLTPENRRIVAKAAALVAVAGVGGATVAWVAADPLARTLYGPLGPTVAPVIRTLAIVFPLGFLALFLSFVLQGLYQEGHVVRMLLLVTGTNLTANWILVPRFGARGAAMAQIASTSLQLLIFAWRLRQLRGNGQRMVTPEHSVHSDGSP